MLDAIGPVYRSQSAYYDGAIAGYRGQIGRNAAIPHAHGNNIVFQPGDVLVTGASAPVWGYHSELERTMVIGTPTDEQRRMFEHMVALQDIAFETIRPGARCSDVDEAVRAYYDEHALWDNWRHHVGHAIGMRYHEGSFLDRGDPRPRSVPAWCSPSSPGCMRPASAASATRTPSWSRRTASTS